MTAIREYVLASVDYENTSEELALAQAELDAAQTAFATEVAGLFASIVPYEITPDEVLDYNSADPTALQARKDELTTEMEALAEGDPLIEQITAEIGVIDRALGSQAATDLQLASESVTGLETEVETLAQQVTDEQLTAALEAAANKNRLAEYEASGETYVDEELLNWAKGILGVDTRDPATGEVREEVDGKIDEVREYLAADASDGSDASTDTVITQ